MNRSGCWLAVLGMMLVGAVEASGAEALQAFENCRLVNEEWADGDSFSVCFPDGETRTVRLYGVDCMEMHVKNDATNARRLLDQRRWFGITDIASAVSVGETAKEAVMEVLSEPFTVCTAFADARGDPRYARVYGFVTTAEGEDLAEWLVVRGLARAFGVTRQRVDGTSSEEWREQLRDLELLAARRGLGAWAYTDWEELPRERQIARKEDAEIAALTGSGTAELLSAGEKIDLNRASRDELMRLPGIGEAFAMRIIERRPYERPDELLSVSGIGPKTLERLEPFVTVGER